MFRGDIPDQDGTIDQVDLVRSLDTENLYFANCEIAWLWFMLEVNNDFNAIIGGGPRTPYATIFPTGSLCGSSKRNTSRSG